MTGRTGMAVLAAVLLLAAPAGAVAEEEGRPPGTVSGSVHAGTMGVGVALAVDATDNLALRGVVNHLDWSTEREVSDIDLSTCGCSPSASCWTGILSMAASG